VRSELKTLAKQFTAAVQTRQAPQAGDLLRLLTKRLDRASRRGILHKNAAARRKARLSHRLAHLAASAA